MDRRRFCDWLPELETEFPVTEWKIDGVRVWPLIRTELYASNFHAIVREWSLAGGYPRAAWSALSGLARWLVATLEDRGNSRRPSDPADVLFLSYSSGRQPKLGGRCLNPLLYPYAELVRAMGGRVTVWEAVPFGVYNTPRATPSAWIQQEIASARAFSLLPRRTGNTTLARYEELQEVVRVSGLTSRYSDPRVLIRDAWYVKTLASRFEHWLRRCRPTVTFIADYGFREMALCLATARLGIPCVEIQHGIQGPTHPMYARWREPEPGHWWELRPTGFWNWDRESADNIRGWGGSSVSAYVGGDAWTDFWLGDHELAVRVREELRARIETSGGGPQILVTLARVGPAVPSGILKLMRDAPRDWCFWVRMHPVGQESRWQATAAALATTGANHASLEHATVTPLPALLQVVDVNLVVGWSTVIAEAAAMGIRSFATDVNAPILFPGEVQTGHLAMLTEWDEAVVAIESQSDGKGSRRRKASAAGPSTMRLLLDQGHSLSSHARGSRRLPG